MKWANSQHRFPRSKRFWEAHIDRRSVKSRVHTVPKVVRGRFAISPTARRAACGRTLKTRRLSRSHRTARTETPRRLVSSPGAIQRQLRFRQSGQRRRFPTPPSKGICQPAARRRRRTGSGRSWTKTRATPRLFRRKRSGEGRRAASPPYRTAATAGERARPSRLPD